MKKFLVSFLFAVALMSTWAGPDLSKDKDSHKVAKEMMREIYKGGRKETNKIIMDEIFKMCGRTIHKRCYFWEKSNKFYWQELDRKGQKKGKIFEKDSFIKKIFK